MRFYKFFTKQSKKFVRSHNFENIGMYIYLCFKSCILVLTDGNM